MVAYQQLISMFWHFDKSGVFDLLDNYDFDFSKASSHQSGQSGAFASLQKQLDETSMETRSLNSVQALDIQITRQWMRMILWRLAASHGFLSRTSDAMDLQQNSPLNIAHELLHVVSQADTAAIEAHGPALVRMFHGAIDSTNNGFSRTPRYSKLPVR